MTSQKQLCNSAARCVGVAPEPGSAVETEWVEAEGQMKNDTLSVFHVIYCVPLSIKHCSNSLRPVGGVMLH